MSDSHTQKLLERNQQLEKLEKLSTDLYHAAPTLPAIPVPKIGEYVDSLYELISIFSE